LPRAQRRGRRHFTFLARFPTAIKLLHSRGGYKHPHIRARTREYFYIYERAFEKKNAITFMGERWGNNNKRKGSITTMSGGWMTEESKNTYSQRGK